MNSENQTHIMLDLETLGTAPGSSILQIGAVLFDSEAILDTFEAKISRLSCTSVGLTEDAATLTWWEKQNPKIKAEVFSGTTPLLMALEAFYLWKMSSPPNTLLWANGAGFDPVLLEAANRKLGVAKSWNYRDVRCYRTIRTLFPYSHKLQHHVAHTALTDATFQAKILQATSKHYVGLTAGFVELLS